MKPITTFYLVLILAGFISNAFSEDKIQKKPFATFVMVHFEVGGDSTYKIFQDILRHELRSEYTITNRSLSYQKALWPTVKEMVQVADKYDVKLSLALNSQWAEYILQDEQKTEQVREWIRNGHELALHHHGINHIDWNGYSNRQTRKFIDKKGVKFSKKLNSDSYRGSAKQGFEQLKKLALRIDKSYKVITGCITDTAIDKPQEISILTEGSTAFDKDFLSKPVVMRFPGSQEIYWFRHYLLRSNFNTVPKPDLYSNEQNMKKLKGELKRIKKNYDKGRHDEVVGIVFHAFDYYRAPQVYISLFKYLNSKNTQVETIRTVLKRYKNAFLIESKKTPHPSSNPRFKPKRQMR